MEKIPDDVGQFSRVCANFKERIGKHPCQMPENILELIIKASFSEDDLILNPFGGRGTTAAVAKRLNRNFITIEISPKYYNYILNRLKGKISETKEIKKMKKRTKNFT